MKKHTRYTLEAGRLARSTMDIEEANQCLQRKIKIRKIGEVIAELIEEKSQGDESIKHDLMRYLVDELGPQLVGQWANGIISTISRASAIKVAYVMQMTVEQADQFLKRCWHDGFYMRDIKDVIYVFGLEYGAGDTWRYRDMVALRDKLIKEFEHLDQDNPDPEFEPKSQDQRATQVLEGLYHETVETPEDLRAFIIKNQALFGNFRRKAYEKFMELYNQIKTIKKEDLEKEFEMDHIVDNTVEKKNYKVTTAGLCSAIGKGIPELRQEGAAFTALIRSIIAENVPARAAMSEIRNKYKRDGRITTVVDRKLLILIWLASEGSMETLDSREGGFKTDNPSNDAEEHIQELNRMLRVHAMGELDPRHPFDWIIMNSMYYAYLEDDDIEYRIQDLVDELMDVPLEDWDEEEES